MCTIDWDLLLRFLTLLFSWPPVALAIVVIVLALFRRQLRDLIGRVRRGSAVGVSVEFTEQAAIPTPNPGTPGAPSYPELVAWFVNEKLLNIIYGSQYNFLRALAQAPNGLTEAERDVFFAEHRTRMPASPWNVDDWLRWPVTQGLVRISDENGRRYRLGPTGMPFLQYLARYYSPSVPWRHG